MAPDFTLDPMEPLLESPRYAENYDLDPLNMMRPIALKEFLLLMDGYEAGPAGRLVAKPFQPVSDQAVTLSDFRGKKPVMLLFMDPTDAWAWCGKLSPAWEPLYQAVGDKVAFFIISTTIHDRHMPIMDFFKPGVGRQRVGHPLSQEERARRCKAYYMAHPNFTIPYLLDDLAAHVSVAYCEVGGAARAVLVDKEGRVAFHSRERPHCYRFIHTTHGLPGLYAQIKAVPSLMEANVAALLANDGIYDAETMPVVPEWGPLEVVQDARLKSYDPDAGLLTVTHKGGREKKLIVDEWTRVLSAGEELAQVAPGTPLYLSFVRAKEGYPSAGTVAVEQEARHYWNMWRAPLWHSAVVLDTDPGRRTITARLHVPPKEQMKGLFFWKQAGNRAEAADPRRSWMLPVVRDWVTRPDRTFRVHVDRATYFWLNGWPATVSDLRAGDYLGIKLKEPISGRDVRPKELRAYRY
jgi:hypothetical protein